MSKINIDDFKKVLSQLEGLHEEVSNLAKKSNNDALNIFKLKLVNQVLIKTNEILREEYKPFSDFNEFIENDIPTNSDVALVLSQYINCMESLREKNISSDTEYHHSGNILKITWLWHGTKIETYPPKNIKK